MTVSPAFPRLRWAALLWLAVWVPTYAAAWGWTNFLHLCDIAVVLSCLGWWAGSSLLLSSQAVSSIVVNLLWCLDVSWRLLFGQHLVGGTEYMWDAQFPLGARLLSLFHFFWPWLLVGSLRRVGYDRRGWVVQSAIAVPVLAASRLFPSGLNINFAHRAPIFGRALGPALLHLAVSLFALLGAIYWPTHWALARLLPPPTPEKREVV